MHISGAPMPAYRKADEKITRGHDVMIADKARGCITQSTPNIPTHLDSNECSRVHVCIRCCCGKLGVRSDSVPANDGYVLDGRKLGRPPRLDLSPNNVSPEDGSCGACCFLSTSSSHCSGARLSFCFRLSRPVTTQLLS
jgi:hypothetical protein